MITKTLLIFTRTPLHIGAGSSIGAIDQPIQRERHTSFPIIPGSSLKGVFRNFCERSETIQNDASTLFGTGSDSEAAASGQLSFSEAQLVAFPVRSAKGTFALAVSPLTLSRLNRQTGWNLAIPDITTESTCYAGASITLTAANNQKAVVLEEYRHNVIGEFPADWAEKLSTLINDPVLTLAQSRFVLLADSDLSHYAQNACSVHQHVRIDNETGTAVDGALFNAETAPPETLFFSAITALRETANENQLFAALQNETLMQFGGDATTGLGFCTVKLA